MKKSVFIGIDVSKETFDAVVYFPSTEAIQHQKFGNELKGFRQFARWVREIHSLKTCLFCMEDTGNYSYGLCCFLSNKKADFCVESAYRIKHSMGIRRGKTDPADAELIARYACRFADELTLYRAPSEGIMELKLLVSHRNRLLRQKTRLAASIAETEQLKRFMDVTFVLASLRQQLSFIKEHVRKCTQAIDQLIRQHQALNHQANLLYSVPGVGRIIAAHMLAFTAGFTKFDTWRKFACYVGTAPFPYQSGTSVKRRTKVSAMANRKLKALLNMGAINTLRSDNEYHRYYQRRKQEGKHHMVILNAVRNKLISRMFAVIQRDTPYVSLST